MLREGWGRVVVAASGPSLTVGVAVEVVALRIAGWKVIAVNDAWRRVRADALYACDRRWWEYHEAALADFQGERWSSNSSSPLVDDDKQNAWPARERLRVQLVEGRDGEGFSSLPGRIHYGNNSGFQAVNLALQFGARRVLLVGFDMKRGPAGEGHFFGEHPKELAAPVEPGSDHYRSFVADFNRAAAALPAGVEVLNCNPDSALRCFPFAELCDAVNLAHG